MIKQAFRILSTVVTLALAGHASAGDKPLKVYLLAGQSNMQGQAQVRTIDRLKLPGGNMEMYEDIMGEGGKLTAPEGVRIAAFSYGDMGKGEFRPLWEQTGPLVPGFNEQPGPKVRYGPEYTFGIYMKKHAGEPILIIKTAWGGRNLLQQFRPPSAGEYAEAKDKHGNKTGAYYQLIIEQTKKVLANLGDYHPDYNPAVGHELAGFVWFQGFNDMIMQERYGPDYAEYTRLLSCLIRDVRKDLNAPNLPAVIGVMGIQGPIDDPDDKLFRFRKAQAAVSAIPEFQDNVAVVHTAQYWDMEYERLMDKVKKEAEKRILAMPPEKRHRNFSRQTRIVTKKIVPEVLNEEELAIVKDGTSNQAYHYLGSALIYGNIGKAFADAMHELSKKN